MTESGHCVAFAVRPERRFLPEHVDRQAGAWKLRDHQAERGAPNFLLVKKRIGNRLRLGRDVQTTRIRPQLRLWEGSRGRAQPPVRLLPGPSSPSRLHLASFTTRAFVCQRRSSIVLRC